LTAPTPERKPFSFVDTYAAPAPLLTYTRRGKGMDQDKSKYNATLELVERGHSVRVILDARKTGVRVPARFNKDHSLALDFGKNLAKPVHDLCVTDHGISGTLSFGSESYLCFVPWSAVWMLVHRESDRQAVFTPSIPPEILQKTATYKFEPAQDDRVRPEHVSISGQLTSDRDLAPPRVVAKPGRPVLTVIKGGRA
jgi:stringent starvation protein B